MYKCFYCDNQYEKKRSRGRHSVYCSQNKNRKILEPWNKGQTQETNEIIAKTVISNKLLGKYPGISRPHTEQSKKKLSEIMKKIAQTNPNYSGRYNRGNVKSMMCSNGMTVLGS